MLATRIIAIRHGETAWNVDSRIQGHLDIPLNDVGRAQAARAAAALADESVQAIYASDLLRAYETAQAIAQTLALPVQIDKGLREREFGVFQGRTFAEIEAEAPELAMRWRKREPDFSPEGGESLNVFRDRIVQTASALASAHLGQQIVLVAHGGVMDVLYRAATGQEVQAPRTWQLSNAAINRLLWTPDGFTLVGWADTQHLDDLSLDENAT
jgi:probable phosphoglycerate mutase